MLCAECDAFEKAYRTARAHHATIAASLLKIHGLGLQEQRIRLLAMADEIRNFIRGN